MSISSLLEKLPRLILYGLIFLLPVFFLPFQDVSLDFAKQIFLAVSLFLASALWLFSILIKGKVNFKWHIAIAPLFIFLFVALISARGSGSFLHSFWGVNGEADSLFNILLFVLFAALALSTFKEREHVLSAIMFFIGGAVLGAMVLLLNLFFPLSVPFASIYAFALYSGGAFVLALWLLAHKSLTLVGYFQPRRLRRNPTRVRDKSYRTYATYKIYLIASAVILFVLLALIDMWVAWLGIAASMLLLVYYLTVGLKSVNFSVFAPYLAVFALASSFLFIDFSFLNSDKFPAEVRLSREVTIDIAQKSITSSTKNMLFGSGPATFVNQYRMYRDVSINSTPFWNTSFYSGTGAFASFFVTTGILGGGILAVLWLLFLVFGATSIFKNKTAKSAPAKKRAIKAEGDYLSIVFAGGLYFFIAWIFYQASFLILFSGFLAVVLWVALEGRQKNIDFVKSSQGTFFGMTGSVLLLIVIIFGFYTIFRAYIAETSYQRSLKYVNEKNYASALDELQIAAGSNNIDKYWRKLSQAWFLQATQTYKDSSISGKAKDQLVQRGISNAESAAINAAQLNPLNSTNYEQLGDFYRNIISVSASAINLPFTNYDKAEELNPANPFLPLKKARAHYEVSKRARIQMESVTNRIASLRKEGAVEEEEEGAEEARTIQELENNLAQISKAYSDSLDLARAEAERALALKKDFNEALEFIASLK